MSAPRSLRRLAASLALMLCTAASAHGGLACVLQAPARAEPGRPVPLRFTLTNQGPAPVHLLVWNTPFEEAWFAPFVEVSRDGIALPYAGPMAKRGDPSREEYIRLAPGASRSAEVDLAQPFDLSQPGHYRVEPRLRLFDVVRGSRPRLPRPRGELASAALPCNAADVVIAPP